MDSTECSAKSKAGKLACENIEEELECAVCLQPCIHPVRLPCSHIFCFLCVKGVANQSKRCAMCRQEIPADFLDNPLLVKKVEEKDTDSEGYQWFYEGRNGWWQYDERTSGDLEIAYGRGLRVFEVLVAGFLYSVDFDRMIQQRRSDPSRRRRIKRDLSTIPKKGVAGLKMEGFNADESDEARILPSVPSSPPCATDEGGTSSVVVDPNLELPETTSGPRRDPSSLRGSDRLLSTELESLYLLHSDLPHTVYRNQHRRQPLSLQTAAGTAAGVVSRSSNEQTSDPPVRKHPTEAPRPRSAPIESTRDIERGGFPRESIPVAGETDSVDNLTGRIRTLILDTEGTEFYSLDGVEEYTLSNDES